MKVGDIVLYKNTRGRTCEAVVTEIAEQDEILHIKYGKTWFHGVDCKTKAKVFYPVWKSEKMMKEKEE